MSNRLLKRIKNIPPHKAIIAGLVAIIGVLAALLIIKHTETPVEAFSIPRAARLERVDGSVDMMHSLDPNTDQTQADWVQATPNTPLTVGDRVYARENSRAAIALTGRKSTRLDSDALIDVISLDDQRTQLALRSGSATFDVGDLASGELFEVATPNGAVDFLEPGLYQLSIGDDGNTTISVLRGLAQVVGQSGTGQISAGQVLTLTGAVAEAALSTLAPDLAGDIVDDYYSYRYPDKYDGRYKTYSTYIDEPNYYDPYSQSASYSYLSEDVPGLYDLDRYGDWEEVDGYGRCWAPRDVSADWSPYSDGYWDVNDFWGPTWVSNEAWGYAPYHYGRWTCLNSQRWVWVPEGVVTRPVYAPALVAFYPLQQTDQIAWVPLAPGERYGSRCYDANFQPRYLDRQVVAVQQTYVNVNYPTAVTVIPVREFSRRFDRREMVRGNAQLLAQSRPVLDPFAVESVREIARRGDTDRRGKLPRELRREIINRQVVTSVSPRALPVQTDVRKAFQVEAVTDKQRKNKLKIAESGQVANVRRPDRAPMPAPVITPAMQQERQQKMGELAARAEKGDQTARHDLRQMKREQRKEDRAARAQGVAQPQMAQPQGAQPQTAAQQGASRREQLHQQMKQEQQQRAATEQTQREQKRAERQAQRQAQQQQPPAAQQQQLEQRKQMQQQARQARAQQEAARQGQVQQQRQQNKAQRQAERQQRQAQPPQQVQKQQQVIQQQRQQAAAQQAARQSQMNQERAARKAQQQQGEQQRRQQMIQQQQQRQQQMIQQQQRQQQRVQPQPVQPRKPPIVMQQTEKNRVFREQQRPPRIQQTQPRVSPQPKQRPPAMAAPPSMTHQMNNAPHGEKRRKP